MALWLLAFAAAALLLLGLRLLGPRRGRDLLGPPRPKRRRLTGPEALRLRKLVARGDEEEALRLIRDAGHGEARARLLIAGLAWSEAVAAPADPPPDPGWTEAERRPDGLSYGRLRL